MRIFKFVPLVILILALFVGCSSSKEQQKENVLEHAGTFKTNSCQEVTEKLIKELKLEDMMLLESDDISKHYGFDISYLDDYSAYSSKLEGSADEVAVFKIDDKKQRQETIDKLMNKIKDKKTYFDKVNKKESEKFSMNPVSLHGNYIVVIICNTPEKANAVLDEFYE